MVIKTNVANGKESLDDLIKPEDLTNVNPKEYFWHPKLEEDINDLRTSIEESKDFGTEMGSRNFLFRGSPGTGKTLGAMVLSRELEIPFYDITPLVKGQSQFIPQVFEALRRIAAENEKGVIAFIDEIDGLSGRDNIVDPMQLQAFTQLLSEIDGTKNNSGVFLIGSTNRQNDLDEAMRARFSEEIEFLPPDKDGRLAILNIHAKQKGGHKFEVDDADIKTIADKTYGYVGRDLKQLLTKSFIHAKRNGRTKVAIEDLQYGGRLDLIKAAIKIMKPDFGLEFYIYNDFRGKGMGSSASTAVLIIKLLDSLMNTKYNDYQIVEIAYKAERDGLKRKGGLQDQYASVLGGFNIMEFGKEKPIIYPLKLKEEIINELESHLILCYIGNLKNSGIYGDWKQQNYPNEQERIDKLTRLKKLAYEIRDALLTNDLSTFGRLLNETWLIKRVIDEKASNNLIDYLYEIGIKNGAYGGRLLGTREGGCMLFFHSPKARNRLTKALKEIGGEIISFNFESNGIKIWDSKLKF